jgi:hypothetical protein
LLQQQGFAPADSASYLGGLLWNLETYQHGCCVNYGYDYGRRASTAPSEVCSHHCRVSWFNSLPCLKIQHYAPQLVEYLENIQRKGQLKIKCTDLIGHTTTAPLSDGLSCLAAIPPQAWHIVPEPYSWLVHPSRQDRFEELYNSCFHPETRAFDIESFSRKCNAELLKSGVALDTKAGGSSKNVPCQNNTKGKKVSTGDYFWTVLKYTRIPLDQPFEPPEPFVERIPRLRRNARIRATKIPVKTQVERNDEIAINTAKVEYSHEHDSSEGISNDGIQVSVHDIPYNLAFRSSQS